MEEPTLPGLWLPSIATHVWYLRRDGAFSGAFRVGRYAGEAHTLDRRIWHPPVEPRDVLSWVEDLLACHLAYELEVLAEHRAAEAN